MHAPISVRGEEKSRHVKASSICQRRAGRRRRHDFQANPTCLRPEPSIVPLVMYQSAHMRITPSTTLCSLVSLEPALVSSMICQRTAEILAKTKSITIPSSKFSASLEDRGKYFWCRTYPSLRINPSEDVCRQHWLDKVVLVYKRAAVVMQRGFT